MLDAVEETERCEGLIRIGILGLCRISWWKLSGTKHCSRYIICMPPSHPHDCACSFKLHFQNSRTMRSFATAAGAAAVLSTARAFAPQIHKSPLGTVVSASAQANSRTMRSFATAAGAAAVLSTARAFAPQIHKSPLGTVVSAPATSNVVLRQASREVEPFDSFDYMAQWYPVAFARDVPYNKPTKVSVFDVDYVICRTPYTPKAGADPPKRIPGSLADDEEQVYAVLDACPHKAASLSEGRIICDDDDDDISSVRFQCAYHGWSVDASTGKCVDIPQVAASSGGSSGSGSGSRADTTAVPALIQQGVIFIFPGGLEKALLYPPPPRVPELDEPGYRMVPAVRDFPTIDWPCLLENILDPDHGLFAHQAKPFDLYTGSKEHPQTISEEVTADGKGVIMRASVTAVDKLTKYDRERKLEKKDAKLAKKMKESNEGEEETKPLVATTTFYAPTHIVLARKDEDGLVASQTVFWVCPTGTGRSRFLSTFVAKIPPLFPLPRWLGHVVLNNFLDQDTHLLASAQKYVLDAEAKALVESEQNGAGDGNGGIMARRSLYVYRSPSEKLQARLALFFDKTLPKVPNRSSALRRMVGISKEVTPPREITLDRYNQHTKICPDSLACVAKCDMIRKTSKVLAALAIATKLIVASSSTPTDLITKINQNLGHKTVAVILGILAVTSHLAGKLKNAFYFAYPESKRDRDLEKIPTLYGR